jgi:protein-disulfide isomerase
VDAPLELGHCRANSTGPNSLETIRMVKCLRSLLLAGGVSALLIAAGPLAAQEFNDKQREEIGAIVRDYLLKNPEILREAFQALERKQQEAEAAAAKSKIGERASEIFRHPGDLVAGNPDGKITLVEFFDYNCGYCKRSLPDVLKLVEENKDLKIVMKEWPILGPGSTYASKAAIASREQGKYWDFHLALMEERGLDEAKVLEVAKRVGLDVEKLKADMEKPEVQALIDLNMSLAESLNIQGTPAFLIDEHLFPGAVGFSALAEAVQAVRGAGGCKVC